MDSQEGISIDKIDETLTLAKLSRNDVKPYSQMLHFTDEDLNNHDYKLLQLDSHLLSEITAGNTLFIKGEDEDEVVICSETSTFHVTEAETSNSLLLVNDLKLSNDIDESAEHKVSKVSVSAIFFDYLEATVGKPHLKKINDFLSCTTFKGPEFEHEIDKEKLFSLGELANVVQASNKELREALNPMNVIELEGKIRLLDFSYQFRVLSYMFKLIEENSWQLDEIDFDETVESLTDLVPREVVCGLFDKYAEESKVIDSLQLYKYKENEVCTFFASALLHGTEKLSLEEFMQVWTDSVPEGMVPKEEMLYGIAIINRNINPNIVVAFDENTLPEDIIERFKRLFEVKEKWSVPEIAPYIRRLTTEKLDVNALLAKYARASKVNGIKYYSSKHGK
nr:sister chromatid cohesion protein DCC1 [Leptinotarsa decemlineata]